MNITNSIAQQVIAGAKKYGLLGDGELFVVPEAAVSLNKMASQMTDDMVSFHEHIGKQFQLPLVLKQAKAEG